MGKRKHSANGSDSVHCTVIQDTVGPALVTLPAVGPSDSAEFHSFTNTVPRRAHQQMIACETERVQFIGKNFGDRQQSMYCRYMVGVRDKKSNQLTLQAASVFPLERTVKALAALRPAASTDQSNFIAARNQLQETFGNKKQKAAVRARERNQVDVERLEGVADIIRGTIVEHSESVPLREEIEAQQDAGRPIPPCHVDAQRPEDVYLLKDVVSDADLRAVPVNALLKVASAEECEQLLPYSASSYVNERLALALEAKNRHQLQLLFYLSCLFAFHHSAPTFSLTLEVAQKKCPQIPAAILSSMLERFTEDTGQKNKKTQQNLRQKTDFAQARLISYAIILCLHLDQFSVLINVLSHDFSLPPNTMRNYARNVGCTIRALNAAEAHHLGLSTADAAKVKKAVLTVPVKFEDKKFRR